jgi:hypothetical protein
VKITNDPRISVRMANHLLDIAAGKLSVANGTPLTAEQEAANDEAADIIEYANEIRLRFGKPAVQPQPKTSSWS